MVVLAKQIWKRILQTIFFKRKFEHLTSKFNEFGLETVHKIYLNQLLKETVFLYLKRSPLEYLKNNKFSYRRSTFSTSNGMILFYRCKTKMMENSLSYKIVKCFNFLMSIGFFQITLKLTLMTNCQTFSKIIQENYIIDNVQLIDNFF